MNRTTADSNPTETVFGSRYERIKTEEGNRLKIKANMEKGRMKEKTENAIEYCERVYPETCEEFKKIQKEMYETFCKKQRNYGPGNISVNSDLETKEDVHVSLTGLWFRMNDKINRLKQLVVKGEPDEVGEPIQDTYEDLSVYGIIAQIVQRGKWGK